MNNGAIEKPDQLANWIDAGIDIFDDESLLAKERAKKMWQSIGAMQFPNEQRRAAAIDQLRAFCGKLPDLITANDSRIILLETAALHRSVEALARPLPEVTPEGELEKHGRGLTSIGFNGLELEAIKAILKPDERILSYDASTGVRTDQRKLDRTELRLSIMPRNYVHGQEKWLEDNFPRIPSAEEEAERNTINNGEWRP